MDQLRTGRKKVLWVSRIFGCIPDNRTNFRQDQEQEMVENVRVTGVLYIVSLRM